MHLVCHDIVDLVILGHDSWYLVLLCLRVSSLVRFYKSRFWFFSENFLNQISEKIVNPEIFCCQPFKNEWKLVVLLLFSKFSASVSYFWQFPGTKSGGKLAVLLLFSNFLRCFSRILTNFSFFSEKIIFFQIFFNFFQKFLIFSQKFQKKLWIQKFSAASHSKMKETSCFAAVFKVFS